MIHAATTLRCPATPIDEPANFAGRFGAGDPPGGSELWSKVWPAFRSWLQQPVPEHDLDTGEVVGERPRWKAIAPYVGITAATLAVLGVEAYVPAVAEWLGTAAAPQPTSPLARMPRARSSSGNFRCLNTYYLGRCNWEITHTRLLESF
jgi:hypothetical protein